MPNLMVQNKEQREELARLQAELDALKSNPEVARASQYSNLKSDEDGRQELVEIVYGSKSGGIRTEKLPLQQAFDKLVSFYSSFTKMTDRNVLREYADEFGRSVPCNNHTCYVSKSFKDMRSGQRVENLRKDVPLWLAVDDVVQKDHKVELISKKEYNDFYREHTKAEIRKDRIYLEKKRQELVDEVMREDTNGA